MNELAENNKINKKTSKGKPRGKAFPKGTSGNPGGRPKKTEQQVEKEKKIEESSRDVLAMIAGDLPYVTGKMKELFDDPMTPASVKVRIWVEYMDRIYGKAFQAVQIDTGENNVKVTIDEPAEELSK